MTSNAIETRDLSYRASGEFAISDVSLNVPTGSLYGFLGPNGSGKTTTIKLLLGLLLPNGGTISILGNPIPGALPAALARTGVIPDRPHLHRYLTVAESIELHRAFHPRWDAKWAGELMEQFRLRASQKISRLSKGETAKVMVLQALCQKPDLLVLDEPMDGLDPVVRRDVLAALLEYVSSHGATVLVSSHLVHELERFCDWIGVMDQGRLVVEMPMSEFRGGNKRLQLSATSPLDSTNAPFTLLAQQRDAGTSESWVVRGWRPEMSAWFARDGVMLHDVADLDLEDGFVELLRAFRNRAA